MREFLDFTIVGITAGAVYAVAASGLVVTYTTSGIFNFAHGAVGMLAAFTYWQLRFDWGWPTPLALVVVLFVLAPLFGALVERVVMRGLERTSEVTRLVVSIALLAGMIGLAQVVWDTSVGRDFQGFFGTEGFTLGSVRVTYHRLITVGVAVGVAVGLRAFLFGSRTGVAMRAVVDNRSLAELNGARPNRASMLSWAIGFSLAALAGILIAPILNLNVFLLTLLVVNAYAAAVVGRLTSLPMTFLGAIILGLAESYAIGYLTADRLNLPESLEEWFVRFGLAIPMIMLFAVLILMPRSNVRGRTVERLRESVPRPSWNVSLWGAGVFVVVVVVVGLLLDGNLGWSGDSTWLSLLARALALAIIGISLVPLVGYGGQISLCQMTFAGIGAVTMAHWGIGGSLVGLVVATVVAGAVGVVVALPALRLRGVYLALATMAFAVFVDRFVFSQVRVFEGGSLRVPRVFGSVLDDELAYTIFLAVMVAAAGLFVVWLRRGALGRRLQAMRDSEAACATLGIDLTRTKVLVFAISSAMAGFGGALLGGQRGTVVAAQFQMFESLPVLLMAVSGGIALVSGAVAGLLLFGSFDFWIDIAPDWQIMGTSAVDFTRYATWLAPGLIAMALARNPNGLVSDVARLGRRVQARVGGRTPEGYEATGAVGPGTHLETLGIDRDYAEDDVEVINAALDVEFLDGDGRVPEREGAGVAGG